VKGVTLRDKARSCDIRKTLNVEQFLPDREIPATLVRPCVQEVPRKISEASATG